MNRALPLILLTIACRTVFETGSPPDDSSAHTGADTDDTGIPDDSGADTDIDTGTDTDTDTDPVPLVAQLDALDPTSGPRGLPVTLLGSSFGADQGTSEIHFGATPADDVLYWSDTQVVVRAPGALLPGGLDVTLVRDEPSNALGFTVTGSPYVVSVAPQEIPQRTHFPLVVTGYALSTASTVTAYRDGVVDPEFVIDLDSREVEAGAAGAPDTLTVQAQVTASAALGPRAIVVGTAGGSSPSDRHPDYTLEVVLERGNIETVAGNGLPAYGGDGGRATSANLKSPGGVAFHDGLLFVADTGNHCVRAVNRGVATRAVSGFPVKRHEIGRVAGTCGASGFSGDGASALDATLNAPRGLLAIPGTTLLLVADTDNNRVRIVNYGSLDATWGGAAVSAGGIATLAGSGTGGFGGDGGAFADPAVALNGPTALAHDPKLDLVYVADTLNYRVRVLNGANTTRSVSGVSVPARGIGTAAGSGTPGSDGDGDFAVLAKLNAPKGVAVDGRSVLYVADTNGHRLRAVNPTESQVVLSGMAGHTGVTVAPGHIVTMTGTGSAGFGVGAAGSAALNHPQGLAAEPLGVLYYATRVDARVRMDNFAGAPVWRANVDNGAAHPQSWSTNIGGTGAAGFGGDGGLARTAQLSSPEAVALDVDGGSLYVADTGNHRIRRILVKWPAATFSGALGDFPALPAGESSLDSETGVFTRPDGSRLATGIRSGVFPFSTLNLPSGVTLRLTGKQPLMLASAGSLTIDGSVYTSQTLGEAIPGTLLSGPSVSEGYCDSCQDVRWGANANVGTVCGANPLPRPHGESMVPLAGGGAASATGYGRQARGGGALGLLAQGPITIAGSVQARGQHGFWPGGTYGGIACIHNYSGAGGSIRLVTPASITVSGTLRATGPLTGGAPDGRVRLEAPSVVTAGATVEPAPVTSATLGAVPGL